jgi:uncharacterized protein YbjT (DUF2867 family)
VSGGRTLLQSAKGTTLLQVFVLGVTGAVGSRVASRLVSRGDHVHGLYRRREQAGPLQSSGVTPVLGDLAFIAATELAARMAGSNVVVFAAGAPDAGRMAADAVDGRGLVTATAAAEMAGVSRFIHISAFPDAWRDRRMSADFEYYMKVKRQGDVHLTSTKLDWVIVRPGTLADSHGTGCVRVGPAIPYGDVSRDDVADVFAELVHATQVSREILELTQGTTPIPHAVAAVAELRRLKDKEVK